MKNLSLLIIIFALLEDWIYALVVMIHPNIKLVIVLLQYGLGRTTIIQGKFYCSLMPNTFLGNCHNLDDSSLWYFLSKLIVNR